MDEIRLKLRENLKKAEFEVSEKEEEVIFLLLKHKYGLYAAEVARAAKLNDSKARNLLYSLRSKGLLESRDVEAIASQDIARGHKLSIPEGYVVVSSKFEKLPYKKGDVVVVANTDIVIDRDGYHIPFQRESGRKRSVMFKIKKELFKILSQT